MAVATQRPLEVQEMAVRPPLAPASVTGGDTQLDVGVEVTSTWPAPSTAAQNEVVGQDRPVRLLPLSIVWPLQVADAPGFVEERTPPLVSTATQSVVDGQEMALNAVEPSIWPGVHELELAGAAVASMKPRSSTARHSDTEGHDTEAIECAESIFSGPDQPPVDGVVVEVTLPVLSTATQSDTVGQETEFRWLEESAGAGPVQASGGAADAALAHTAAAQRATASTMAKRRPCVPMLVVSIFVPPESPYPHPRRRNPCGIQSERWNREPSPIEGRAPADRALQLPARARWRSPGSDTRSQRIIR